MKWYLFVFVTLVVQANGDQLDAWIAVYDRFDLRKTRYFRQGCRLNPCAEYPVCGNRNRNFQCNSNNELTKLVLPKEPHHVNKLTGAIPKEFGQLTSLTHLDLSGNELTGAIPKKLGQLTSLAYLDLSGNKLTGAIPKELGQLTSLTHLDLSGNELTGAIPKYLWQPSLTYLDLGGNKLTGAIPNELGQLTSLTHLNLGGNELTGAVPKYLWQLMSLTYLDLSGNTLIYPRPKEMIPLCTRANCPFLQLYAWKAVFDHWDLGKIGFQNSRLKPCDCVDVSCNTNDEITQLRITRLSYPKYINTTLTGAIPKELGLLTSLTILDLRQGELTGAIPNELGLLTSLTYLGLSGNELTGAIPK
jgi:Leucine-rich repeat (LRR) protein